MSEESPRLAAQAVNAANADAEQVGLILDACAWWDPVAPKANRLARTLPQPWGSR